MRSDYRYREEWRPYESLDPALLSWAARVGDFSQDALFAVAEGLSKLVSPGAYWMNSAEVRGLITRHDDGMHGRRWYSISDAGRERLAELAD